MLEQARQELVTLRDFLRFSVSRFNEAGVFFGHGSDNAWDEAVYLLLHTLHLPLDRLEPFLDARLTLRPGSARCERHPLTGCDLGGRPVSSSRNPPQFADEGRGGRSER